MDKIWLWFSRSASELYPADRSLRSVYEITPPNLFRSRSLPLQTTIILDIHHMFSRIYKYQNEITSYDVLKFIAIITMIIDHIGVYFVGENTPYWRAIGLAAAPLFFFISGSVFKYHIKLSVMAYGIFITVGAFLLGYDFSVNILLVIICIKWVLDHWDPCKQDTLTLFVIFALLYFFSFFLIDCIEFGLFGFAYAFCGRLLAMKANKLLVAIFLSGTLCCQFYERIFFNKNLYVAFEALLVIIILFFMMIFFEKKVFPGDFCFKNGVLIFSRYSLEIYFWHFLLFETMLQLYYLTGAA